MPPRAHCSGVSTGEVADTARISVPCPQLQDTIEIELRDLRPIGASLTCPASRWPIGPAKPGSCPT